MKKLAILFNTLIKLKAYDFKELDRILEIDIVVVSDKEYLDVKNTFENQF